jgi:hypothetical protein
MRTAYGPKVVVDGGKVIAVSLGSDQCAEHEWGIDKLRRDFNCNDNPLVVGLERRKTRKAPAHLSWQTDNRKNGLRGMHCPQAPWGDDSPYPPNFNNFPVGKLCTAWDEKSFAAFSNDKEEIDALLTVYEALQSVDGALWLGGGGIFQNAGLCIGIASRLPAEVVEKWERRDNEAIALKNAMLATGIEAKLKAAKLEYFALSPRFDVRDGSLTFWLNPCKQHLYESGWVTLRDLEDWIQGKGKCMKQGRAR